MKSKRIVITRAATQADKLAQTIEDRGAIPVLYPCIAVEPPADTRAIDQGLKMAARGEYNWIVFTSTNTVTAVRQRLTSLDIEPSRLAQARIAAVGPGTAQAIESELGIGVTVVPPHYEAEGLIEALRGVSGMRMLIPQSDLARPLLADGLTAAGAVVRTAPAYRIVLGKGGADVVACLGTKTTKTAESHGIRVTITPPDNTLEGLVDALAAFFAAR
ncbi:MAG: uroporphyrinogen-III synthase [bacterium]